MRRYLFFTVLMLFAFSVNMVHGQMLRGRVMDEREQPLLGANIVLEPINKGAYSDEHGRFAIRDIAEGKYILKVMLIGYISQELQVSVEQGDKNYIKIVLMPDEKMLSEIEVFGERYKQPEKMEVVTRLPLRPSDQVQSISVVSHKMIADQGAQTLGDVVRNAPGLSTFTTYGGTTESITARGYRGIPVLKNGVRVQSDFRGQGFLSDMQGVESVQVIKGAATMSQGLGNDIGSAGGVVNIATKTPQFRNYGEVGLYAGSWGKVRPMFDVQRVLSKGDKVAFRLNGAFERADSYRIHVSKDRVYINPSLAWKPDNKTEIVIEADYMHDSRTPDQGTINLQADSINDIYNMPHDKFLGMASDRFFMNNTTYMARINRELGGGLSIRFAYYGSVLKTKNIRTHASQLRNVGATGAYNLRSRALSGSYRYDHNSGFQLDFVGKDIATGRVLHTFQVGIDYKTSYVKTIGTNSIVLDTIDVLQPIVNTYKLKAGQALADRTPVETYDYIYGFVAQDFITFNKYVKVLLGIRYGLVNGYSDNKVSSLNGNAWDPMLGIIVTPFENINIFGSYTTTTSLRGAANLLSDRVTPVGKTVEKQFEAGVKSEWFNHRLRFNATFFHSLNDNLTYGELDNSGQSTGYYIKAGNLLRKGLELELTGRLLTNLDLVLGYTYLDAQYRNSPYYNEGSAPMNSAKHTANGWLNYKLTDGLLKNLSFGLGAYYVGKRPFAEYTNKVLPGHDVQPNTRPFLADAFTTVNLQVGYAYQNLHLRVFANNIFNSIGYTSYYRGGYLNPTDPRNFAVSLTYKF